MAGCRNRMLGKFRQSNQIFIQPLAVWFFRSDPVLQFRVIDDASFQRIDEQHLPGLKAPLEQNVLRWNIENTDL